MGIRTTISSHDFIHVGLNRGQAIRNDIDETTPDDAPATKESPFLAYLNRGAAAARSTNCRDKSQGTFAEGGPTFTIDEVMQCSFSQFYRKFRFASAGAGKKGKKTVHRVMSPTIAVVRPRMPRAWGLPTSSKRVDYCRVQLQMHKPFQGQEDYDNYLQQYYGDVVEAYKVFTQSVEAPACCRDDIRPVVYEEEGDLIDEDGSTPHGSFAIYAANYGQQDSAPPTLQHESVDWKVRNEADYSDEQIADAPKWQAELKKTAIRPPVQQVNIAALNDAQAFAYRIVEAHHAQWQRSTACKPLRLAICGTAGSGKTFLIRALKQLLGDKAAVTAPTGVAADNIGGATYHSLLPIPITHPDRPDVKLAEGGARLGQMKLDLQPIQYLIIDEMSMVGRRSLGQIDELLQQAKGNNKLFGNVNVILVGDHGQLPPVNDKRSFSWTDVKYTDRRQKSLFGTRKPNPPLWGERGLDAYESFFENVVFLDRIMRVADGRQQQLDEEQYHFARAHLEREQKVALSERTTRSTSAQAFAGFAARQQAGELNDEDLAIAQQHHQLLDHFRELQLRARSGDLTDQDYEWMKLHMNLDERRGDLDLGSASMYRLVTTRAKRDEINTAELRRCIEAGQPAITIKAHTNTKHAAQADEDDFGGLRRSLQICVGARVMVTHNLCVAHGLVNGTLGIVHDVIVSPKDGEAVAVLLTVKRRTAQQEGYSGPCFLRGELAADDPATEVVVAISRYTINRHERSVTHTRKQFPIMPAW